MHVIKLTHSTATGHRIPGHDYGRGKCARLHGHTYKFVVTVGSLVLDRNGFVLDFGWIKSMLDEWDHRMVLWDEDSVSFDYDGSRVGSVPTPWRAEATLGVIRVPFVPTAENIAEYFATRLLDESEDLVFATIEVHESPLSYATATARREFNERSAG